MTAKQARTGISRRFVQNGRLFQVVHSPTFRWINPPGIGIAAALQLLPDLYPMHWVAAGKGFSFTCNGTTLEVKDGCLSIRISAFAPVSLSGNRVLPLPFVIFNKFQAIVPHLAEIQTWRHHPWRRHPPSGLRCLAKPSSQN